MKKVVIILLIVVLVLMVLLVVLRPGGNSKSTKAPGWVELIGSLTPAVQVKARDVAGQNCWDDKGVLTVQPGQSCVTELPSKANRIRFCIDQGPFAQLRIKGDKYAPQDADQGSDACPGGEKLNLYDDNSKLIAVCLPTSQPCVARLL